MLFSPGFQRERYVQIPRLAAALAFTTILALSIAGPAPAQIETLRAAAEAGSPGAAFEYGYALTFPDHTEPDHVVGRYWLSRAADAGDPAANHVLGMIYRDGIGTDPDLDRARAFFELAWQAGDIPGGYALADLLIYEFRGEERLASSILEQIVNDPDTGPQAALLLAELLFFPRGDIAGDAERASRLARDALHRDPDLVEANYLLGLAAMQGVGMEADPNAARDYWRTGAERGDTLAMLALGDAFRDGAGGEPDAVMALAYYTAAAALGDPDGEPAAREQAASLSDAERLSAQRTSSEVLGLLDRQDSGLRPD